MAAAAELSCANIVAVSDQQPVADLSEDIEFYSDWQDLIGDDSVEAVSICLPHFLHEEVATAALGVNKHVLMEKPLACTVQQGEAIVGLAAQLGLTLMVELTHRFYTPVLAAKQMVAAGRLGRLLAIEDRIVESVPDTFPAWLTNHDAAGGGVALTNGIHMLDRIAFVTGEALTFMAGSAGAQQQLGNIEDTAAMQLQLASGVPVQLLAQWRRGDSQLLDDELTFYGTKATLRVWAWRGWRLELIDGSVEEEDCYDPSWVLPAVARLAMADAIAQFCQSIRAKETSHPTVQGAITSQRLIESFYKATGRAGGG